MNLKDFIIAEEAPMGDPMGGAPMGDPMGGAPMGDPMGGGMPPMDPMGGGMGGASGGIEPTIQFKPNSVWDVIEKILDGEPVNDEDEEEEEEGKDRDQSGQENLDMLDSPQQQEPGMAPTGPEAESPQPQ